jgi:hypothetical protein
MCNRRKGKNRRYGGELKKGGIKIKIFHFLFFPM